MAITLTGNILDVTTKPVDEVTTATVKAPTARLSGGAGIISSSPATVTIGTDGAVTIDGLAEGLAWLYLEGKGWSDSIALAAASGMTTLVEAIANAAGAPGLVDYMKLLANLDQAALDKVGAAWETFAADVSEEIDRGTAEKWLTVSDVPNYETLPTGNYRATCDFLRGIGIDGAYAGRFVRTYTSEGGNFTDRAEYVAGGIPYVWYQTKTSAGLSGWKSGDADMQGKIATMEADITGQAEDIKRGTGEAWLTAADIPNYATLKPGNYRALAEFLEGIGIENPRAGRFHRTWTNTSGTNFTDHVTWIETATIVHNRYRSVWSTGMGDWINPAPVAVASSDISASRQEAVRERLFQSRGGRVGTGGKGVVALRFDHGVPAFTEHILPMLEARGLPASQCHHVDDPEASWTQANTNFGSGVEVHSHSWTHRDTTSDMEIRKEIVESRQELESLIPNALVAGWMTPGAGTEAYDGWWAATGLEARAPFYAQELIDSTYGSADTSSSVWNVLGARHWGHRSIDRDSGFSQYQSLIDQAANTKTGVVLMVHPTFIRDQETYIDFSEYEQVLDYIVAQRDAGKIEVLTVAGMTLADPSTDYRDNMLHGDLSLWSGWGSGASRTGDSGSGALSHDVSLANIPQVKGHVREFTIDATGTGALSIRIYDNDVALLDITRSVQVTDSQKIRIPVGIPRGGSRIRFSITCSSGSVTVTNPKLQAV